MAKNYLDKTGLEHFWAEIKSKINAKQNKITYGSTEPTGGSDGDVYLMAVNEDTADKVGDLSTLLTNDKTNVASAINEIFSKGIEIKSYSLGTKGYIEFTNGFIINWGTSSVTTTSSTGNHVGSAVTFAKAFPTAVVFAGASRQGTNQHQYFPAINAFTKTTITAMMSTAYGYASTWTVRWFAIGY